MIVFQNSKFPLAYDVFILFNVFLTLLHSIEVMALQTIYFETGGTFEVNVGSINYLSLLPQINRW